MRRIRPFLLILLLGFVAWFRWHSYTTQSSPMANKGPDRISLEPNSASDSTPVPGPKRIATARAARERAVAQRCEDAGLPYPPRELFFRAFKHEAELEVWGREVDGEFRLIGTYPVTASSGKPGPKRREGDRQVPEGCYRIVVFNSESSFHLSLGLDYPNASDKVLSDPDKPGFDIYIHGGAASVGCLPLGDDAIEEVFLLASDTKGRGQAEFPIHIFPARMEGPQWSELRTQFPEHVSFWQQLEPIYRSFQTTRKVPRVEVEKDGSYRLKQP